MAKELRFGIKAGDLISQHWTLKAMASRPDAYLTSDRTGRFIHLSLHDPAYGIHVKATTPGGHHVTHHPWPNPLVPGVIRVAQIVVPPAMATYAGPGRAGVVRVEAPDDPELWVSFDVMTEEPGAASREAEWDKSMVLVGRVDRSDGGTIAVAASLMRGTAGSLSFKPVEGDIEEARRLGAEGKARALVGGTNPDGSVWFLELRTEPEVAHPPSAV